MKPRLYLDEDVNPRLADLLRRAGYDVLSARDAGALGESDREQFERARSDRRAIVTYNYQDFERIAKIEADGQRQHSGIVVSFYQYNTNELGTLTAAVRALLDDRDASDLENAYLILPTPAPR